jgi:ribosomal protein L14E/L6E/L27E
MDNINSPFVSKPRNAQHREIASKQYLEIRRLKLQEKVNAELNLDSFCENFKEYKNYYPKANLSYVIEKSNERKNFKKEIECENLSSSRLTLLKNKRRKLVSSANS